ncbi:Suppressor of Ty [Trichinella pseudospiralis]
MTIMPQLATISIAAATNYAMHPLSSDLSTVAYSLLLHHQLLKKVENSGKDGLWRTPPATNDYRIKLKYTC